MAGFMEKMYAKAKESPKKVVLPEGNDIRTIEAAAKATELGVAEITILGNPEEIRGKANQGGFSLDNISIIDMAAPPDIDSYSDEFYELRKHKNITKEQAKETMMKDVYY